MRYFSSHISQFAEILITAIWDMSTLLCLLAKFGYASVREHMPKAQPPISLAIFLQSLPLVLRT